MLSSRQSDNHYAREIAEIPAAAERLISNGLEQFLSEGRRIAELNPRVIVTCARGTSDHAATYFKYLVESRIGIPVASIGPSVASVYKAPLKLSGAVCVSVSQSGASPDLVALQRQAGAGGARSIAVVNNLESPVAIEAQSAIPIHAGPELAVAATKSFVNSLIGLCGIFAGVVHSTKLPRALRRLPEALDQALECDWSPALAPLADASSLFAISRGPSFAVALEAALKLKETCRIHAEACSAAEVRHGPVSLASSRLAALCFVPSDRGRESVLDSAMVLRRAGAAVFLAGGPEGAMQTLPVPVPPCGVLTPICHVASFYKFSESLAAYLGEDANDPHLLTKVTRTV